MAQMNTIERGDPVRAIALDGVLDKIATTGIVPGNRFPVVWVCRPEEWQAALQEDREPDAVPWPAEDVRLRASTSEPQPPSAQSRTGVPG
jgi:hypothetical protein